MLRIAALIINLEKYKNIYLIKKTSIFLSYSEDCVFVAGRRECIKNCDSASGFNPLFLLPARQFSSQFLFLRQDSLLHLLSPHSKLAKGIKLIFFFLISFSHLVIPLYPRLINIQVHFQRKKVRVLILREIVRLEEGKKSAKTIREKSSSTPSKENVNFPF